VQQNLHITSNMNWYWTEKGGWLVYSSSYSWCWTSCTWQEKSKEVVEVSCGRILRDSSAGALLK